MKQYGDFVETKEKAEGTELIELYQILFHQALLTLNVVGVPVDEYDFKFGYAIELPWAGNNGNDLYKAYWYATVKEPVT